MKILITGASGKIGEALYKYILSETDHELILLSSNSDQIKAGPLVKKFNLSILNLKEIKKLCYDLRPNVIVNCSAMTDVDECETNRKLCWDLNVFAVENLVSICRVIDAHLINFSTDYIFDGQRGPYDEDGYPEPLSYYGKSKHACENYCRTNLLRCTIIRTNVVYGYSSYDKPDFVRWIIRKLENEEQINIITGQYCNPTLSDDIARGVMRIVEKKLYGVYNFGGATWLNRFQIANQIADVFKFSKALIKPMDPAKLEQKAKRPEKGGLITLKAEAELLIKFSTLENGLILLNQQLNEGKKYSNLGEF